MQAGGVEVTACGTCLHYQGLKDLLAVGSTTNLYDLVETIHDAAKCVRLSCGAICVERAEKDREKNRSDRVNSHDTVDREARLSFARKRAMEQALQVGLHGVPRLRRESYEPGVSPKNLLMPWEKFIHTILSLLAPENRGKSAFPGWR